MKYKLPKIIQDQLSKLPESGMGYQNVNLVFRDGKSIPVAILNGEFFETDIKIDINNLVKIIVKKINFSNSKTIKKEKSHAKRKKEIS